MQRPALTALALISLAAPALAQAQDHQHHSGPGAPPMPTMQAPSGQSGAPSEATAAYMAAMDQMHGPMMQGAQEPDPDVAFVKGMIPHHQGAIDMARVVLRYGRDEQARKWANDVIREQQREIDEMQAWLRKRGR